MKGSCYINKPILCIGDSELGKVAVKYRYYNSKLGFFNTESEFRQYGTRYPYNFSEEVANIFF
jgi:hypothetical protein